MHSNRVLFKILEANTSVKVKQLESLYQPAPFNSGYKSQNFPIYPLTINLYLENPPFNTFEIIFHSQFIPSKIILQGSEDNQYFFQFYSCTPNQEYFQIKNIFKEVLYFHYLKLTFSQPLKLKANISKQIQVLALDVYLIEEELYKTQFLFNLQSKIVIHPTVQNYLQILEFKYIVLKDNKLEYQEYLRKIQEIKEEIIFPKKVQLEKSIIEKYQQLIQKQENTTLFLKKKQDFQYPDPIAVKKGIVRLKKQLKQFYDVQKKYIKPNIEDYFIKYKNKEIKQRYLQMLSEESLQKQNQALTQSWNEYKKVTAQDKTNFMFQAYLMLINYYFEIINDNKSHVNALKMLVLFLKKEAVLLHSKQYLSKLLDTCERIIFNLIKILHKNNMQPHANLEKPPEDSSLHEQSKEQLEEISELCLKNIYMFYEMVPNDMFIKQILLNYKDYPMKDLLQKLEILQKLTFRDVSLDEHNNQQLISFLLEVLLFKELTLTQKNKAYNIVAYMASKFGKESIFAKFQKLNSMILMSMEKIIDKKMKKISKEPEKSNENQSVEQQLTRKSCDYCGVKNHLFKDQNIYNLHIYKECKYFTSCQYCHQNIEIPELYKHYITQCTMKNQFINCDNCNEVIFRKEQQRHDERCARKLQTKCPLCESKVESKLKIKEHLLKEGCPNQTR